MQPPQICVDIRLNDWYAGYARVTGKKRDRMLKKEHERLHRESIAHINLDDTYDEGNGIKRAEVDYG